MADVIVLDAKRAVEEVAHEEQMTIWVGEVLGALSLCNALRDDLTGGDVVELHKVVARELRDILEMAFDHPAARTIMRKS